MVNAFESYHIEERSYVAYIKREIHQRNLRKNFTEKQIGEIDIIVSEITSNLIKYAGQGEVLFRTSSTSEGSSFEILCLDKGEGMADTLKVRRDGFSTSTTLGQGLGAIERLSNQTELYSIPGWGTVIYARVSTFEPVKATAGVIEIVSKALLVNKPRELVCGDGYWVQNTKTHYRIIFGDGLGHGQAAKDAVLQAIECFRTCTDNEPVEILRKIHDNVRRTRGLVATIAVCNKQSGEWRLCGIGNILTRIYSGIQYKNYMPYNGTLGLNMPNSMNSSTHTLEKNQHIIMCSDGITSRWDLNRFPAVLRYDGIIAAACIYKDYVRGTDDASVLVTKVS